GWAAGAAAVWAHFLVFAWRRVDENVPEGQGSIAPRLGWGNGVTLVRAGALALLAGSLVVERTVEMGWLAVLYGVVAVGDGIDGWLARRTGHATPLGKALDLRVDVLAAAVVGVVGVRLGRLPPAYLALSFAYFAFQGWVWARRRLGLPCH